jgi:GNAT superfamily N-acetyltransferase
VTDAFQIRPATIADIPSLADLIVRSARALSRGYYTEREIESAIRHVFGVDSTLIADGTYYVVSAAEQFAGCGGWSRRRTLYGGDQRPVGPETLLDPADDPARIRAFFVAPRFARRGVGRLLFGECAAAARRSGFRALELMATLPGVPFYEALGFTVVERVTDVLPDGVGIRFVRMTAPLE